MWSSNCLPTVSFSLEFETVTAVGLQSSTDAFLYLSPSPCVSHSGYWCPTLWISLVTVLVSWFPLMCLPLWLMVSGSPDASLHWSLFICLRVWLVVSPILASVVWLSRCLSLPLPSCVCHSGKWCPDVFSLLSLGSHHLSLTMCVPIHLSLNLVAFNHQLFDFFINSPLCAFSILCFSPPVSHLICLSIHMSPLVAVSCSCFITISFVRGPYLSSFLPCAFLLSQEVHQHRLQIAITWKTCCFWFMLFSIEMD